MQRRSCRVFTRCQELLTESCSFTVNSIVTVLKAAGNVTRFQRTVEGERSLWRPLRLSDWEATVDHLTKNQSVNAAVPSQSVRRLYEGQAIL